MRLKEISEKKKMKKNKIESLKKRKRKKYIDYDNEG